MKMNCFSTILPINGGNVLTSNLLNELAHLVSESAQEIVKTNITPINLDNDGWCEAFRVDVFFYEKEKASASDPHQYVIMMETAYECDQPFDWDKLAEHYTIIPSGISSCYAGPSKSAHIIVAEEEK